MIELSLTKPEHIVNENNGPTPDTLAWCGIDSNTWEKNSAYIMGKELGTHSLDPAYEYQTLLCKRPNNSEALKRISFMQLRTLLLKTSTAINSKEALKSMLEEAKRNHRLENNYDVGSEADVLLTHELSHLAECSKFSVRGFLVVHPIRFNSVSIEVILNVQDLERQVDSGVSLTYTMGKILAAPVLSGAWHYPKENDMAVDLLKSAQEQGTTLSQDERDLIVCWEERLKPTWLRTCTRKF